MGNRQRLLRSWLRTRRRMRSQSRAGSAAIEFAMIAPVLFLMLFGMIETGVLYFGVSALQNATDDAGRMVRTGQTAGWTASQFKAQVCSEMTGFISSATCTSNLQIDMRQYSDFADANYPSVTRSDGSINPTQLSFPSTMAACQVVLIRAFYPWSIMTPLMSPLMANAPGGKYMMTAATAFRSEPYTAGASC